MPVVLIFALIVLVPTALIEARLADPPTIPLKLELALLSVSERGVAAASLSTVAPKLTRFVVSPTVGLALSVTLAPSLTAPV